MEFEASLMLMILRWSLIVTVTQCHSLETCRLETETMRTIRKKMKFAHFWLSIKLLWSSQLKSVFPKILRYHSVLFTFFAKRYMIEYITYEATAQPQPVSLIKYEEMGRLSLCVKMKRTNGQIFKTWCLGYPQCNLASELRHWQFIAIHAASSGATKGFILILSHM